ncbi:hypothetical protein, unlikely [Trypanosoma congolense IL3000]|uniref:Uncharacterized protein n=1 Tax=Trypanosoma congolense (strain IL3000) TaxID=1068625 RepID=F9W5H1_TRYCI|nr:hypothetical protein, unlikely [Trypanosoma congolense IL3000]
MSPVRQSYFRPIHTSPSISLCPTLTAAGQVVAADGGLCNAPRQMVRGSHISLAGLKPTHITEHSARLPKALPFTTSGTFSGSHIHTYAAIRMLHAHQWMRPQGLTHLLPGDTISSQHITCHSHLRDSSGHIKHVSDTMWSRTHN